MRHTRLTRLILTRPVPAARPDETAALEQADPGRIELGLMSRSQAARVADFHMRILSDVTPQERTAPPATTEPDPRGSSLLRSLNVHNFLNASCDLVYILGCHYGLIELERGPAPDGSWFAVKSKEIWTLNAADARRAYEEERPRLIHHIMRLVGRELAVMGARLHADTVREWLEPLDPAALLDCHRHLIGPAVPAPFNRHPLADQILMAVVCQIFGFEAASAHFDRQIEEAILCPSLATREGASQSRAASPEAPAPALERADVLTILWPGGGHQMDVDLSMFTIAFQEREGKIHVIMTPKEKTTRVTFTRGEVEGGAAGV